MIKKKPPRAIRWAEKNRSRWKNAGGVSGWKTAREKSLPKTTRVQWMDASGVVRLIPVVRPSSPSEMEFLFFSTWKLITHLPVLPVQLDYSVSSRHSTRNNNALWCVYIHTDQTTFGTFFCLQIDSYPNVFTFLKKKNWRQS